VCKMSTAARTHVRFHSELLERRSNGMLDRRIKFAPVCLVLCLAWMAEGCGDLGEPFFAEIPTPTGRAAQYVHWPLRNALSTSEISLESYQGFRARITRANARKSARRGFRPAFAAVCGRLGGYVENPSRFLTLAKSPPILRSDSSDRYRTDNPSETGPAAIVWH